MFYTCKVALLCEVYLTFLTFVYFFKKFQTLFQTFLSVKYFHLHYIHLYNKKTLAHDHFHLDQLLAKAKLWKSALYKFHTLQDFGVDPIESILIMV